MTEFTEQELDTIYQVFDRVNKIVAPGTLPIRQSKSLAVPQGVFGFTDTANNVTIQATLERRMQDIGDEFDADPFRISGCVSSWFSRNAEPDPLPRDPRVRFYNDMATQLEYVDRLGRSMNATAGNLPLSADIADHPENLEPPYTVVSSQVRGPMRVQFDSRNNMTVRPLFRGSVQIR